MVDITVPEFKFALREDLKDHPEFLPTRATDTDTGWDVRVAVEGGVDLYPFQYKLIDLGFRVFCPEGWYLELRPRSSTHAKKNLNCLYGIVDQDYSGTVFCSCQWSPNVSEAKMYHGTSFHNWAVETNNILHLPFGERICQLVPKKRNDAVVSLTSNEEFDRLCAERNAARGAGGFGSTGTK